MNTNVNCGLELKKESVHLVSSLVTNTPKQDVNNRGNYEGGLWGLSAFPISLKLL